MLNHHLKIAWRNLLRSKGFSIINIAGLSVGMSVAMLIGLWVLDEFSYDRSHKKADQLYQVMFTDYYGDGEEAATFPSVALPLAETFRESFPEILHAAEWDWGWEHGLVYENRRFNKRGMQIHGDFLKMFTFPMIEGDVETALDDPSSIVLSKSMAEAIFGEEDPMGKMIRVDNQADMTVTGIVQDPPDNSSIQFNFLLPFTHFENQSPWVKDSRTNWGNNSFQLFIETAPGTDEEILNEKIKNLVKENVEETRVEVILHPLRNWRLRSDFKNGKSAGGYITYVRLFGIIGLFVLLIACINFMNLSTARSEKRAREVGVRKTVGSTRGQLIGQFLGEAALFAALAFLLSVGLIEFAMPYFNELTNKELSIPYGEPLYWAGVLVFIGATSLLAGSYPAFFLSSFRPIGILKGKTSQALGGDRSRKILVVAQFTISVALIIGTIVVWQQIQHAKNRPNGYETDRLMMVQSTEDLVDNYELVKTELLASGVVENITRASSPITSIYANMKNVDWPGKDPNDQVLFATVATSWDYTKTLGIKMAEGRDFSEEITSDSSAVIFNQAAIERMGLENPIGQTIRWDETSLHIIGVMEDVLMGSPFTPVQPAMVICSPGWVDQIMFRLHPEVGTPKAIAKLERVFEKHNPTFPFEYKFADEQYGRKFIRVEMIGKLSGVFGGLAIFISCLGLFGLAAYMAERRTKEIGIRKVLGASVLNLWGLLSKDFFGLVLISCFIAAPVAAYFLADWLEQYEYRIELNGWVFVLSAVLAVVVTFLTVSFQSIKAALANPVKSLRSE